MFGFLKKKEKRAIANAVAGTRHVEIAADSLKLLKTTVNPRTFFGRCDDIVAAEERLMGISAFRSDIALQTALQIGFIDRIIASGRVETIKESMGKYMSRLTPDALVYYMTKLGD